jgi:hypothetical protein
VLYCGIKAALFCWSRSCIHTTVWIWQLVKESIFLLFGFCRKSNQNAKYRYVLTNSTETKIPFGLVCREEKTFSVLFEIELHLFVSKKVYLFYFCSSATTCGPVWRGDGNGDNSWQPNVLPGPAAGQHQVCKM